MQYRVWHIPQVPMEAFRVPVYDPVEGRHFLEVLAAYDLFQFEHKIKPDYCNASGLEVFNIQVNEWEEWYDEEGNSIDDFVLDRDHLGRAILLLKDFV